MRLFLLCEHGGDGSGGEIKGKTWGGNAHHAAEPPAEPSRCGSAQRSAPARRGASPIVPDPVALWGSFESALSLLGVDNVLGPQVPYVLRHTGAAADAWTQRRSVEAIQARGRWKSATSVRRYAKGGRIAHQMSLFSDQLQTYALECIEKLPLVLAGQLPPLRPPPKARGVP